MKIFRDDLPAATLRAHVILANAIQAQTYVTADPVYVTEITESAEDVAALEVLSQLGAVEHFDGVTFELTSAGECFRSLVLLDLED